MINSSLLSFAALAASACASSRTYSSVAALSGWPLLGAFEWQSITDPTHGRVNYVDAPTAWQDGLVWVSGKTVGLKADNTSYLSASDPGRNSFRLQSTATYSQHVAIFDIGHMPEGCGTWPAVCKVRLMYCNVPFIVTLSLSLSTCVYREVGADWPNGGEIDIVEGVNNQSPNKATLHTSAGCTQPSYRWQTGTTIGSDCDVYTTGNEGCGVQFDDTDSFGPTFNQKGGGWYAVERSAVAIKIWFWGRHSGSVPTEVQHPGSTVTPDNWGQPKAYWYNTDCDFPSHFGPMKIIINLDFCGDWAGNVYSMSGCPSNCVDFVNSNPEAFSKAYFELNSLHIFE